MKDGVFALKPERRAMEETCLTMVDALRVMESSFRRMEERFLRMKESFCATKPRHFSTILDKEHEV